MQPPRSKHLTAFSYRPKKKRLLTPCILPGNCLIKTKGITLCHLFNRITHCIHQVVEVINRAVQFLARLGVLIPLLVADLCDKIHATGMNDNVIVLYEVNAVVDAVLALPCFPDSFQTKFTQAVNALWFG